MTGVPHKLPIFIEMLRRVADENGIVPSLNLASVATEIGTTENGVKSLFGRLRDTGRAEIIGKGSQRRSARYRLIPGRSEDEKAAASHRVNKPLRPPAVVDVNAAISARSANRLRDRYGIEVVTYQRDRYSEAVSVPRVRFLEGAGP